MSSIHVARQPIFELEHGLFGYELLYRRDESVLRADGEDGFMSAEVIVGALLGIGLHSLAGNGIAFINFSRGQLLNDSWRLLDPAAVVIELLETVECTPETVEACRRMVDAGYRLALDDYVVDDSSRPLLELASIVKIDVLNRSRRDLELVVRQLADANVRLLAERVETATMRDMCAELGFELFQGYLFSRPETLSKTDVSAGQLAIMRLMNLLQDPETTDLELEAAFQADLALCYKLLRIVNAAAVGGRGVSSIQHAIRLVGREMLHRWLSVILIASLGRKGDVTRELAVAAITRARMCELVVLNASEPSHVGSAFIVGLLSLLDTLLEMPMDRIVSRLELSDDIRSALLKSAGPLGAPLQLVEAYEEARWDTAREIAASSGVADEALPQLYLDARMWATEQVSVTAA